MSDAAGVGSGGTSLITQVGPSVSGNSCNTTDPGVDFFYNLDSALTQCRLAHCFDTSRPSPFDIYAIEPTHSAAMTTRYSRLRSLSVVTTYKITCHMRNCRELTHNRDSFLGEIHSSLAPQLGLHRMTGKSIWKLAPPLYLL